MFRSQVGDCSVVVNLIDTLHVQHGEILRIVGLVTEASNRGDVVAIRRELDALGDALLAHLGIEDTHLYPALSRAAEQTQLDVPARIARTYEHNMESISIALKAFLERYVLEFTLADFQRDWKLASQLLTDRIASEEATLYPLYRDWILGRSR